MAQRSKKSEAAACPCGTGSPYSRCCRPFHVGTAEPATAEELMRARYSAYAKRLANYVERTWHPASCPDELELDPTVRWTGLSVDGSSGGGPDDSVGTVEFTATFVGANGAGQLHEVSRFVRDDGVWSYRSGR